MLFNAVAGTNYGYLNRKPDSASLLDLLPGWPAYVVLEILVVSAVWALMTWPFARPLSVQPHRSRGVASWMRESRCTTEPYPPTVTGGYLERPAPSGLADVIEIILDKGIVIDAYVRVSVVGIELLTIDARIVVASVDTYLRFAEATNRLDLYPRAARDSPSSWRTSRAR